MTQYSKSVMAASPIGIVKKVHIIKNWVYYLDNDEGFIQQCLCMFVLNYLDSQLQT